MVYTAMQCSVLFFLSHLLACMLSHGKLIRYSPNGVWDKPWLLIGTVGWELMLRTQETASVLFIGLASCVAIVGERAWCQVHDLCPGKCIRGRVGEHANVIKALRQCWDVSYYVWVSVSGLSNDYKCQLNVSYGNEYNLS